MQAHTPCGLANFFKAVFMATYKIARVGLHHFEEPCLSGQRGSGTIFFSGCNLKCLFCQNYQISHDANGLEVSENELVSLAKYLEDIGAHNINLVTPTNYANLLKDTLKLIKREVKLPIVWNSSGYETVQSLQKLEGLVDVYLPDFKYSDDTLAWEYSHAKSYRDLAFSAISEMRRQQPCDVFDNDGIMQKGVIVRHLVLPSALQNTRGVLEDIAHMDKDMFVSLMGQYFPTENVKNHPVLFRRLTEDEYSEAVDMFFEVGLHNGFSQELDSATEEYVPDFDLSALKELLSKL